jgi:plastocyanin
MIMICTHKVAVLAGVVAASLGVHAAASEAQWGNLKGRFVFEGKPPELKPLDVSKEPFCTLLPNKVLPEELVVSSDGGLANVVVFLRSKKGDKIAIHPDYEKPEVKDAVVVIDNHGCHFEPHVAVARVGQPVEIKNSDNASHNSNITSVTGQNPAFNQIIPTGGTAKYTFKAAENFPVTVSCNIHPWMKAYVIVRDDPYVAVSKPDGTFEIKNLPVGDYEFQIRHDSGYITKATLGSKSVEWKRGVAKFSIKPGDNDLGEIKVKF